MAKNLSYQPDKDAPSWLRRHVNYPLGRLVIERIGPWLARTFGKPRDAKGLVSMSQEAMREGYGNKAIYWARLATMVDPQWEGGYLQLAHLHRQMRQPKLAAAVYAKAADALPDNVKMAVGLGEEAMVLGDFGRAEEAFKRALALEPDHPYVLRQLAAVIAKDRNRIGEATFYFAQAESRLRRLLETDPDNGVTHFQLFEVLEHLGQQREALAEIQRAVELEPSNELFRLTLHRMTKDADDPV